jgi:uncharacterized membrane protein HdeD (DUF308 family)
MKCPKCGKSLWFVKKFCPFCKAVLETPDGVAAETAQTRNPSTVSVVLPWIVLIVVLGFMCYALGRRDPMLGETLFTLLFAVLFIFAVAGNIYVIIKAFKQNVGDGLFCLITLYAAYFALKHSKTVFQDRAFVKVWAIVAILVALFLVSIPVIEGLL